MSAGTNAGFSAASRAIGDTGGCAKSGTRPPAQVFFCIDEREESMRRALEEAGCAGGDFRRRRILRRGRGLQGHRRPHGAAFCPVVVKPRHKVLERPKAGRPGFVGEPPVPPAFSGIAGAVVRSYRRGRWCAAGSPPRRWDCSPLFPLIGNLLAPRRYAQLREWMNRAFLPEPRTELTLMRNTAQSQGTVTGLLTGFAAPRKGRKSGQRSGPGRSDARVRPPGADPRPRLEQPEQSARIGPRLRSLRGAPRRSQRAAVRGHGEPARSARRLRERASTYPTDTWFIGGYHDTCSDDVEFYDTRRDLRIPTTPIWTAPARRSKRPRRVTPRSAHGGSNRLRERLTGGHAAPRGGTERTSGATPARVRALHQCGLRSGAAKPDPRPFPRPPRVSRFL